MVLPSGKVSVRIAYVTGLQAHRPRHKYNYNSNRIQKKGSLTRGRLRNDEGGTDEMLLLRVRTEYSND